MITRANRAAGEKRYEVYVELVRKQVPHLNAVARLAEVDSLVLLMESIEDELIQTPVMAGASLDMGEGIEVPVFVPDELFCNT